MPVDGRWRIAVRPKAVDRNFVIAHELAHYAKRLAEMPVDADEEADADRIAAALLVPPEVLDRIVAPIDNPLAAMLAKRFDLTRSSAVMRVSCIRREDLALAYEKIRVMAWGGFDWPAEATIREWARGTPPGLRRIVLTGKYDAGRVVLRAT